MGNLCNRCDDTRRAFGLAWTSWRTAVNQDEAKKTLKRMGCLYCMALFVLVKFFCLALLFALPIVMIGMGAFYIHDCPRAPIIPIFLIVLGSVGIFEIYQPDYDRSLAKYCDKTLYLFAFSVVTILWILLVLFLLLCLLLVAMLACAKDEVLEEEPTQEVDPRRRERSH